MKLIALVLLIFAGGCAHQSCRTEIAELRALNARLRSELDVRMMEVDKRNDMLRRAHLRNEGLELEKASPAYFGRMCERCGRYGECVLNLSDAQWVCSPSCRR